MHDEPSLFGDDTDQQPAKAQPVALIADWQVTRLRAALDATGLTSMDDRQAKVVEAVGRRVASLRELTADEANLAISRLATSAVRRTDASAWDEREGDTWIDRL